MTVVWVVWEQQSRLVFTVCMLLCPLGMIGMSFFCLCWFSNFHSPCYQPGPESVCTLMPTPATLTIHLGPGYLSAPSLCNRLLEVAVLSGSEIACRSFTLLAWGKVQLASIQGSSSLKATFCHFNKPESMGLIEITIKQQGQWQNMALRLMHFWNHSSVSLWSTRFNLSWNTARSNHSSVHKTEGEAEGEP